ncbi:MAG: DUF2497 domain-containing protein [Rhodospirillales bacterium]|nr:DUF2497 domain-containing protein [Rhodospirillales bacterium]
MSDNAQEKDPSIEEILASIRQIISDDEEEAASSDADAEEESAEAELDSQDDIDALFDEQPEEPSAPEEEDVLELTQKIEEDDSLSNTAEAEDDNLLVDLADTEVSEPEPEPAPPPPPPVVEEKPAPPPPAPPAPPPAPEPAPAIESVDAQILGETASAAAFAGFSKLAREIQINHNYKSLTLEDIVRSQLDPMLRDWLDKNLPAMIETLVREELDKIAKKVTGD